MVGVVLDAVAGRTLVLGGRAGARRATARAGAPRAAARICYYTPSADPSGMGAHVLDLVAAGVRTAEVSVLCRPTVGGLRVLDRAAALGAVTLALPGPRDPSFRPAVTAFLRRHRPDVFHCHVGIGWEDWGGVQAARRAGVPVVTQTQHLPFLLSHPRKRRGLLRSLHDTDLVLTVSDGMRRTYEAVGVAPGRLLTVPNGVRPRGRGAGRSAARRALGLDDEQPVVMTVGRLTHVKGQRYLVAATPALSARAPGVAVVVIGEGPLRAELGSQAAALGVAGQVHLMGHRADARALLDAADVFVLPSRHEGMPLVAIEAMEAGLPVVATRVIGTEEVVDDGVTGILVPAEDAAALAVALADLLADPTRRAAYGAAGRRRYLAEFTAARMTARTWEVYDQLLERAADGGERAQG